MKTRITLAFLTAFTACYVTLAATGCKTPPTNGDTFYQTVVTCTEANTNNTAAGAAVLGCLTGAVGGDYSACLIGLVTGGHWTVDEVACIVRAYATTSAQRLNAGTPQVTDADVLKRANEFLRAEKIGFR